MQRRFSSKGSKYTQKKSFCIGDLFGFTFLEGNFFEVQFAVEINSGDDISTVQTTKIESRKLKKMQTSICMQSYLHSNKQTQKAELTDIKNEKLQYILELWHNARLMLWKVYWFAPIQRFTGHFTTRTCLTTREEYNYHYKFINYIIIINKLLIMPI